MTTTMKTRDITLGAYVALGVLSCVPNKPNVDDAGAPGASTGATVQGAVAVAEAGRPGPNPRTLAYDDKADLPENAGDVRCKDPIPANAKPASVMLELSASPPGIDVVIPSLSVRQKLWPAATNPKECVASTENGATALRFRCTDDRTTVAGKAYARKSDVVLGRATTAGSGTTKFVFPCGTPVKLEPIACPPSCKKSGEQCTCTAP